jgi:hypothetical protein
MPASIQHYLNPLHIYCRLRNLGLTRDHSIFLCKIYERVIFKRLILREPKGWQTGRLEAY